MTNLLAIEDSDQRLNTINTGIQPALKGRNRENLKMIGYVVFEIQHIQSFTVFMYRRPILCTLSGTVDFLNVLKKGGLLGGGGGGGFGA